MLYLAEQCRQKLKGMELDATTRELEVVEKSINEALLNMTTYCCVKFHVCEKTASKLKDMGYSVSLNVSNGYTYISWLYSK